MAAKRGNADSERPKRPPATSPKGREDQLIAMAFDAAEDQIRAGKATSQLLTHFLKLGSTREELERQKLQQENELLKAKVESLASEGRIEQLYKDAIVAMRIYSGGPEEAADAEDLSRV
jgi:hypothetical protein